jgi:hypothetical protein
MIAKSGRVATKTIAYPNSLLSNTLDRGHRMIGLKYAAIAAVCACAPLPFAPTATQAATIHYTIAGTGSWLLDGVSVVDRAFSIALAGDTTTVTGRVGGQRLDPLTSATITIDGLGSTLLEIQTRIGSAGSAGNIIFFGTSELVSGIDLFDFTLSTAQDLTRGFGPRSGIGVFGTNQFIDVESSLGLLSFVNSSDVRFSAVVDGAVGGGPGGNSGVPELATWALMVFGLGGAGGALRHRRQKHGRTVQPV